MFTVVKTENSEVSLFNLIYMFHLFDTLQQHEENLCSRSVVIYMHHKIFCDVNWLICKSFLPEVNRFIICHLIQFTQNWGVVSLLLNFRWNFKLMTQGHPYEVTLQSYQLTIYWWLLQELYCVSLLNGTNSTLVLLQCGWQICASVLSYHL